MKSKELPFRIEVKDSFQVIGYKLQTTNQRGEGKKAIPAHWAHIKENHLDDALLSLCNHDTYGLLGVNVYNVDINDSRIFHYLVAVSSDNSESDAYTTYTVPAMTWAIFPCTLDTIGKTEAQAITKWLPKSNYKPLNKGYITGRMKSKAPDIEYYGKDGLVEVWVAVENK